MHTSENCLTGGDDKDGHHMMTMMLTTIMTRMMTTMMIRLLKMMTMMMMIRYLTMMMVYRTAIPELRLLSIPLPGTRGSEAKLQVCLMMLHDYDGDHDDDCGHSDYDQ